MDLSRQLVRLADDVPVPLEWDAWQTAHIDVPKDVGVVSAPGLSLLRGGVSPSGKQRPGRAETYSLERQRREKISPSVPTCRRTATASAPSLAETAGSRAERRKAICRRHARRTLVQATYHLVDTAEKFEEFFRQLQQQKRFAFDLETTSLDRWKRQSSACAFSWRPGEAWYLAVRGPEGSTLLDPDATLERLRPIFEDAETSPSSIRTSSTTCWCCAAAASKCKASPATRWWRITSCTPASEAITWKNSHVAI